MSENAKFGIGLLMIMGLCVLFGMSLTHGCNKPQYSMQTPDTITRIIARPITIRDTIKTKSVLIKYKDSIYFVERPVQIPCKDTTFIAQADSVITNTGDTVNMAFNYRNGNGYFSMVFRPRPDSIQTISIPVVHKETAFEWLFPAFITGAIIGAMVVK